MPDLLTPLQTVSSVKSCIVALENAVPNGESGLLDEPQRQEGLLTEIAQKQRTKNVEKSSNETSNSVTSGMGNSSLHKGHRKIDSTAFLTQTYLSSTTTHNLSDDALEILKSQPNEEDLLAVLQYLQCGIEKGHDSDIQAPSSKASQITNILVNVTLVDHWPRLQQKHLSQEEKQLKRCLISCLTTVTGLGALLAQIKTLSAARTQQTQITHSISALEHLLMAKDILHAFIKNTIAVSEKPTQRHVIWQELISLLAGSKILTVVAQSFAKPKTEQQEDAVVSWLGDGPSYCTWLAKNIAFAATSLLSKDTEGWSMLAQLTRRGFSLGNRDAFVSVIYSSLILGPKASWTALTGLLRALPRWEQKAFFDGMMRDVARKYFSSSINSTGLNSSLVTEDRNIESVAALVAGITEDIEFLEGYVVDWLVEDNGANASIGLPARRAVMATLSNYEAKLQKTLDKCLESLSDKLQIQHAPMLQQEATVQTMLLAIAYLRRLNPNTIKIVARSSSYIHAVSNRLGASIPRARYLGMIIGVALSRLVDEPGQVMDFGAEELESGESRGWLDIVNIQDKIGRVQELPNSEHAQLAAAKSTSKPAQPKPMNTRPKVPTTSKIISIEEVEESESEDDDFVPYQKPDDDPSDSEEDPTLIDRSKPAAPIYINDLIKDLNDNDNPEVVHLALKNAPALIRRKTGFGTELAENIDRVASSLLNLSDGMSKAEPQRLRLQALIACVVAIPARMGPWLASMYFEGDFSLVQRATLLSTIGLAARDLAGHTDDTKLGDGDKFPSKRLPEKFSAIYAPVDAITSNLSRATLQPMALAAADSLTGPNVLKMRTFSSRLEVEKKKTHSVKERSTRIPKDLHKLLAENSYLPLCCRMSLLLSSRPQISRSTLFEPHIFKLFLQTLLIIMNTLGPHASQLNSLTRETMVLLTHLQSTSKLSLDPAILPAMLQLLLSTLDLNVAAGTVAEERLVTDFGQMIAELMAWIGGLQNMSIPTIEGEGMPWTVIVAGCQVKWQEVGQKFQGRMVGLMGGELDYL